MSVLIYIDHSEGQVKKASLEALSYGAAIAAKMNTTAEGILLGKVTDPLPELGAYGITKLHHSADEAFETADTQSLARSVAEVATKLGSTVIIFAANATGVGVAPRIAARLKAGLVSSAVDLPSLENGFTVKKVVFSGKAFAHVKINTPIKVITLTGNSFGIQQSAATAEVETLDIHPEPSKIQFVSLDKIKGEVPLTEAEIVVSGGRGLKGPENWNLVTDLAHALHGAVACSRPVADDGWRPHHEHVGQTGVQIAPNLYIAIGISGAIQHLGGVNRSKVIVVINKDPEAPFFKAADYGIVGDAFEIVPRLTAAVNKLKG